jgi:hypothetical protein
MNNPLKASTSRGSVQIGTMEIYNLPKKIYQLLDSLGDNKYKIRRAIITKNIAEDYKFVETVAKNRGQNLEVFEDKLKAIEWLKGQENKAIYSNL